MVGWQVNATDQNLHAEILSAIKDRSGWDQKQEVYYQMRHEGLRRKRKPYANAADLHMPLIDTSIEKLKPFFHAQAFGAQRLVEFVARRRDLAPHCEAASDGFDWALREETNLSNSLLSAVDYMLVRGRGIVKVVWDDDDKALGFLPIDPVFLIVPAATVELRKADWICEVRQLSLAEYKRSEQFKQADQGVDYKRLCGAPEANETAQAGQADKRQREGITHSTNTSTVILWEVYTRLRRPDGSIGYNVNTYSPQQPDIQLREPFQCPIAAAGRVMHPYVDFVMEVKDVGYYSSRGVAERIGPFEAWSGKVWNAKGDLIDFTSRPMFSASGAMPNSGNIKFMPGEVLSGGLTPIEFSAPPVNLDQEIMSTRSMAEQSIMMPDFGVGGEAGNQNKTATEVDYIRALSSTGVDLKGKIFRSSFTSLLRVAWATQLYHNPKPITYFVAQEVKILPQEAMVDAYHIVPDGSTDNWNKLGRVQRALTRMLTLRGNPNVNQEELTLDFLTEDDARKARRLFIPTNEKAASEEKDEALEILLLMEGYPVKARLEQDHITRIKILHGKLEQLSQLGRPVDALAQRSLLAHLAMHVEMLQQVDPKAGKQMIAELVASEQQQAQMQAAPQMMEAAI